MQKVIIWLNKESIENYLKEFRSAKKFIPIEKIKVILFLLKIKESL